MLLAGVGKRPALFIFKTQRLALIERHIALRLQVKTEIIRILGGNDSSLSGTGLCRQKNECEQ